MRHERAEPLTRLGALTYHLHRRERAHFLRSGGEGASQALDHSKPPHELSDMQFQDIPPRVIYQLNPLVEVSCELEFAQDVLTEPTRDQLIERCKERYPHITRSDHEAVITLQDQSRRWSVSVGQLSLRLSTISYERWEVMAHHIHEIIESFRHLGLSEVTLVTLSYVHVIVPSRLGLHAYSWKELLSAQLLGWMVDASAPVLNQLSHVIFKIDSHYILHLTHGTIHNKSTGSVDSYLIDFKFVNTTPSKIDDLHVLLHRANRHSRCALYACTTAQLREAMLPETVSDEES